MATSEKESNQRISCEAKSRENPLDIPLPLSPAHLSLRMSLESHPLTSEDGTIVLRLLDENFSPGGIGLSPETMVRIRGNPDGWQVEQFQSGSRPEMIGIAPIHLFGTYSMALSFSQAFYFIIEETGQDDVCLIGVEATSQKVPRASEALST